MKLTTDTITFKLKQKIHYIPFNGCDPSKHENGIIKAIQNEKYVFVVYHCNGDWKNIDNYTAASTRTTDLKDGWI